LSKIGIYVMTHPGDYHLSTVLIRSLRYFGCDVPIMIIPGEGVDRNDTPFDVPIMPHPAGFWSEMGHIDRKFWAFQGPFEKFLYLDADMICTRSVMPFLSRLAGHTGTFIHVQLLLADTEWRSALANPDHHLHKICVDRVPSQLGNVAALAAFDSSFDPYGRYPFNAGAFASTRDTLTEADFQDHHNREVAFFESRLRTPYSWKSHQLFFADQGRLNYLVDRLGIERHSLYPDGNYQWGGEAVELRLDTVLAGDADCTFMHWAGTPRPSPSLFCKRPLLPLLTMAYPMVPRYKLLREIPAYCVWRYFADEERQRLGTARERVAWTWRDARVLPRRTAGRMVRRLRRMLKPPDHRHLVNASELPG
jgi:hypothetical protein